MKSLIARTRELFAAGLPLAERLEGALRVDIELFSRGGLAVLDAIERRVTTRSSGARAISKFRQLGLLGGALVRRAFTRAGAPTATEAALRCDDGRLAKVRTALRHRAFTRCDRRGGYRMR